MPKIPGATRNGEKQRHNPLSEDYSPTVPLKQKAGKKRKATQQDEDDTTVDSKASRQILRIGQDLIEEVEHEEAKTRPNPAFAFDSRGLEEVDEEEDQTYGGEEDEEVWGDEEDEPLDEEVDPTDQDIFNRFHPSHADPSLDPNNLSFDPDSRPPQVEQQGTDLASLILSKIAAHEAGESGHAPTSDLPDFDEDLPPLPEKAIQVYTTIGQLLSRQRSGPLPKPFKILPSLPPYQIPQLLDITNPLNWTPYAHYASVRLFISMRPDIAQPYLTTILLPKVREEIAETKKLHVHLYSALKKSLYKPACFFKGILFPLLEDGTCTLREAHIIASVVTKVSVPVLHSAAALLRLCDIGAEQFTTRTDDGAAGAVNIFIRCLLDKKYALPYKVVDALVFHFMRFKALDQVAADKDVQMGGGGAGEATTGQASAYKLTVLWHQSLLSFAQRYRNDITEDQREALLDLVAARGHKQIGPEVRRELLEGRGRGVVLDTAAVADGGDDTMVM